jgi:hypothetical protein
MSSSTLKPLAQWRCDVCGQLIASASQGMLQWYHEDTSGRSVERGFRIVHNAGASPRRPAGNCYYDFAERHFADSHLEEFLGPAGLVNLLAFIDVGPLHNPTYSGPGVADLRELTEIARRLFVPYYEEARCYWRRAKEDGFFEDANEAWPYLPDTSLAIIQRFGGPEPST